MALSSIFLLMLKPLLARGSSHTSQRAVMMFVGAMQDSWLLRISSSGNALHCFEITKWKKTLLGFAEFYFLSL